MNKDLMFSSKTDLWETPQNFFDGLDNEFHFTLDACALPENTKCKRYFTPYVFCPTCTFTQSWYDGEPYEEPTPTQELDEVKKLMKVIEEFKGDLARISFSNVALIRFCKHLIANGVTFMEG